MITHEWDEILSRPFQCAGAEDEWDREKIPRFQKAVSLRNKSHITYSAYMSTSMYLALIHSHICIKMHFRRQYSFILPTERRQHSQMPIETSWDLSPASTSQSADLEKFTSVLLSQFLDMQNGIIDPLLFVKMHLRSTKETWNR